MELISQLNEASGLPIDDLKKVMMKDARIKQVFSKSLALEDIRSVSEFLQTLKFFVFNNRNVIEFIEGRDYVKAVDKRTLKKFREMKPLELKQKDIDDLLQFMVDLFREHAYVERSGMSPSLRKELLDWVNANGRYFDLTRSAQKELLSLPNIRPTRPMLLYRGLLFSSSDLRERKRYDGQLEVGKGLQFLRSVRDGTRIVDLEWDRASSWSTSRQIAMQFAKFGPAQSNFGATLQWLERGADKRAIDGDLGFIISTLAQPDDILIQVDRMVTSAHMKHGNEGEVILKPGTYTCRISTKYTKEGEVDPIASSTVDDSVSSVIDAVRNFQSTWLNEQGWEDLSSGGWRHVEADRTLSSGDVKKFLKLASGKTREEAIQAYRELKEFYDQHVDKLQDTQIDSLMTNPKVSKIAQWIKDLRSYMNGQDKHQAFRSSENPRGKVKVKELSPEQARESQYTSLADRLKAIMIPGRYTDSSTGNAVQLLAKAFGGNVATELHRKSRKDQEAALDSVLDSFFKAMDKDRPAENEEALKVLRNAILAAERNAGVISKVLDLKKELSDVLKSETD